ncbi:MAG: WYL domain-containing transcriptional regulator [Deltaproteobacteria bacterium]|nr:WYL domain-containing transcriptional regulator [Deltaproteobacteria bacterium]
MIPPLAMEDRELSKAQALVRLVQLLQRRGGIGAHELMNRFELDARTLRRYLADIADMGIPVAEEGHRDERVVSIDRAYARTGVQLTLAEALSLHFGRSLFTFLDGTTFAADMDDAIERLAPAIGRFPSDAGENLDRKFMAVPEHRKDYARDGELLDEVVSALLYSNPADAEYRALRGLPKLYRLEPYTLATYRQGLYVFARDVAEDRVKSFAVERFVRFSRLRRERFEYPADWDPRAYIADAFGITGGPVDDVVARFSAEAAPLIRERSWHPSARVEPLEDGGVRLRLRVAVAPELREWLLGFGAAVVVETPASLAGWVRDQHLAAARRYAP